MKILIVTDAWHPQVNGVVRTLDNVIRVLSEQGYGIEVISPDQFYSFPMPSYSEIRLAVALSSTLRERITNADPQAIHIATEGPLGLAAAKACVKLGRDFTTSYHTRFPEYLNARIPVPVDWTYAWLRRFHNKGKGCLVATQSVRDDLAARGFKNLMHWTRGVDRTQFNPDRRNENFLSGHPRPFFVNVGRLAVEKNVDAFLDLDLPGTKIVVGDGPDRARLRKSAPEAVFLGEKHGAELAEAYASSDVFVFPSLTDTFGNVITEAMACGTPVAAFPVAGPKDILFNVDAEQRAGIIDSDLRRACIAALEIPRDRVEMASREYTWEKCADQFLDAIMLQEGVDLVDTNEIDGETGPLAQTG